MPGFVDIRSCAGVLIFPGYTRLAATAATAISATAISATSRATSTTGSGTACFGKNIIEHESFAAGFLNVIDLCTTQIVERHNIDVKFEAIEYLNRIKIAGFFYWNDLKCRGITPCFF